MKETILVTGGAGFIGSNFIHYLLSTTRAIHIINIDKLTYSGNKENLNDVANDPRYTFVKGDICDKKLVARLMRRSDIVVNFAAESHVDRSIKDPSHFIATNITGTQVLLDAAKHFRVRRFIQVSTDEVYGSVLRGYAHEASPLRPNSPYAASKAAADLLARSYFVTYGMPVIVTRSSNNFGPYQYPEKVIPLFITNLLEGKKVPLYADGSNRRDWIFVKDNCDALAFVMKRGAIGQIYNIGGGNELKNITLTRMILKMLGETESMIAFVKDRPGHDKRYAINTAKLRRMGWKPKTDDFTGKMRKTVHWYRKNRTWWKKLKTRREKFW